MKPQDLTKLLTTALVVDVSDHAILRFLRKLVKDANTALLEISEGLAKVTLTEDPINPRMVTLALHLGHKDPIDHCVYWNANVCLSKWTMHYEGHREGQYTASVDLLNTETRVDSGYVNDYFSRLFEQPDSKLVMLLREHLKKHGILPKAKENLVSE